MMITKKKILVTGANGQLGSEIRELAPAFAGYDFLFTDYEELSITDETAVTNIFVQYQPDYCINCAAFTAVDKAEDDSQRKLVKALNADAVGFLAKACKSQGTKFIHISTDYVFDGNATRPYKEDDQPNPVSVYGMSKLEGEQIAAKYTDAIIFRTAWVYSSFGKNFVKTMMQLMKEKPSLNVVNDQFGTPTYAADLAIAIMQVVMSGKWVPGIYHYTNRGEISWYDFALAIKEIAGSTCEIHPIPTSGYPTPAKRPTYSVLDKSKIISVYNMAIPHWKDSLRTCIGNIQL